MTCICTLKSYPLVYLATVYTSYPYGIEVAFRHAAALAARLMQLGVKVYSPIAHTHPLAIHGGLNPLDHDMWMPFDQALMDKSDALAVARMEGWQRSRGIAEEIKVFELAGKPIHHINPNSLAFVE